MSRQGFGQSSYETSTRMSRKRFFFFPEASITAVEQCQKMAMFPLRLVRWAPGRNRLSQRMSSPLPVPRGLCRGFHGGLSGQDQTRLEYRLRWSATFNLWTSLSRKRSAIRGRKSSSRLFPQGKRKTGAWSETSILFSKRLCTSFASERSPEANRVQGNKLFMVLVPTSDVYIRTSS